MEDAKKKEYRPCVVAVFVGKDRQVLLGKRKKIGAWQFPQGGVEAGESFEQALRREMREELGCFEFQIEKSVRELLRYDFPNELQRENIAKQFKGQEQKWFLCSFIDGKHSFDLKQATDDEFTELAWHPASFALEQIIQWKKAVYREALKELGLL